MVTKKAAAVGKANTKDTRKKRRDWKPTFLQALSYGRSATMAARAAGISRSYAYKVARADKAFMDAWNEAEEEGTDLLEDSATSEALAGNTTLKIFLLKARRPDKYRETLRQQVEHSGKDGAPLQINFIMPKE